MIETENDQYIVAIGASAGGLDALSLFFDHTPVDGVSYIIIQHLSPDFKSRMAEILAHHSKLEILEAAERMPVEVNKVYLIPNTKYMGIKDGRLFLIEKETQQAPHMTVDAFFTSLAEERGHKAIGVILSGVGSDGSRGCCAIQDAGGIVLVQEPSTAKFDGMPKAAIAMCNPNFILPAEAIPLSIEHYVHKDIREEEDVLINEISTTAIVSLIKEQFPFDFTEYKIPTLIRRIRRRMIHFNLEEEDSYHAYLKNNPEEIEVLIGDFLIGVTSFFRDPEAFQIIENDVIPQLIDQKASNSLLKIWVASCATGEEAYSLAILVKEYLDRTGKKIDVKIFATDINRIALDHASKGVYLDNIETSVSTERLMNFFDKGEDHYKIKPEIRSMLIFARHDLAKNPPYCYVDLISCRNMLIYVKPVLQKQILAKLSFGLQKNGYLFLGSSESLSVLKDDFLEVSAKWKIYQTLQNKEAIRPKGISPSAIAGISLNNVEIPAIPKTITEHPSLARDLTEVVLEENGFCGVSIDEDGKVIQIFGDLTPYLKPERFNFNLQELLPEPLSVAFSSALHKVLKLNEKVRINKIFFNSPGSSAQGQTDLIITPYLDRKGKRKGMLVLFKEFKKNAPGSDEGVDFNMDAHVKEHIFNLEEELLQTRHELQSANEFLESSKEAMQSFNEELLSANEELQSANEELQSINEELETINSEHKSTILELSELNDDLNNYFNSNTNGQLFVDSDILLKKFSPGAVKHINLKVRDIGRPLSNITTNIRFETLIKDIQKVIKNRQVIMKEIQATDDRVYQVTTSPYITQIKGASNGAVITFYDITELKRIQKELDSSNKMLLAATDSAGMGTWSMNIQSREFIPSLRMKEIFGFEHGETMTYKEFISQISDEYQTKVTDAVNAAVKEEKKFDVEFSLKRFNDDQIRWVRAAGNLTHTIGGTPAYFTGLLHDVTENKKDDIRKNDFIAMVSHELKTPITSLQAYIQMLSAKAKSADDTFTFDSLAKANSQVKKMTALINGFLNISHLESGKINLNKQNFEICNLVGEVVGEVILTSSRKNILTSLCPPLFVNADRDKIEQVVNNLLTNAVKYSSKDGSITVTCEVVDGWLQISIKDEGIGVKPEDQKKLFDRYFRAQNMQSQTVSGFGIGLYLCEEIIERHKGKIWLESELGKGSTFYFSLPLE